MNHPDALLDDARTTLLRSTRAAERMLADALHALRDGRTHITDEFIDRTLCDLRRARQTHDDLMASV